jgi:hypothetical protein
MACSEFQSSFDLESTGNCLCASTRSVSTLTFERIVVISAPPRNVSILVPIRVRRPLATAKSAHWRTFSSGSYRKDEQENGDSGLQGEEVVIAPFIEALPDHSKTLRIQNFLIRV